MASIYQWNVRISICQVLAVDASKVGLSQDHYKTMEELRAKLEKAERNSRLNAAAAAGGQQV